MKIRVGRGRDRERASVRNTRKVGWKKQNTKTKASQTESQENKAMASLNLGKIDSWGPTALPEMGDFGASSAAAKLA